MLYLIFLNGAKDYYFLSPEDVPFADEMLGWGQWPMTSSCSLVYNDEGFYAFIYLLILVSILHMQ